MPTRINCIYNDKGAWCNNENIKRSLFGIGARCCKIYPYSKESCKYQEKYKRPSPPPAQPPKKIINEDVKFNLNIFVKKK